MSDVFIVLFISLLHFWFICKSDPRSHYLRVLLYLQFRLAHSKFSSNVSSALLIEGLDKFYQEDSMLLISGVR